MAAQLPQNNKFFQLSHNQRYKAARKAVFGRFAGRLVEIGQKSRGNNSFHYLENVEIDTKRDFCISRVASEECKI